MPSVPFLLSFLVLFFTICLLVTEYRDKMIGRWLFKVPASLSFVALTYYFFIQDGSGSTYALWIFIACLFCALGDVLLIPKEGPWFLYGVGAFFIGHAAYLGAFYFNLGRIDLLATSLTTLFSLGMSFYFIPKFWNSVPEQLRIPVILYITILTLMFIASVGAYPNTGNIFIPLGGFTFYISDLSVALRRFDEDTFPRKLWGLPLYFASQVILAWSIPISH